MTNIPKYGIIRYKKKNKNKKIKEKIMSLKRISMLEEVEYLKRADSVCRFLGNGSSRVVFSIGDGKCIKVASDVRGQYQNHVEIELFKKYGGDYLAEIYAYGKYIVVMDEVDPIDDDATYMCNYFLNMT